ncbi:MAG: coenzyme F420-0:L-glutamate ligase [Holosporales bacterium]|nr:coenzyme F420-0:L-glutamate ligase [Holosporales bacterium]
MHIKSVKFPVVNPGADFCVILKDNLPKIGDNSILAITSKIVSLFESRVIAKKDVKIKADLVKQESDFYLETSQDNPMFITIKHGMLIPAAGIDESNGDDRYVLYPLSPFASAERIWRYVKELFGIKNLGVIITDSHTTPMRRGVTGIALSWCGLGATRNCIGRCDIFKNRLQYTYVNNIDALAAAAVFTMGEADEQTPTAIITNAPNITFTQAPPSQDEVNSFMINLEEDLYGPILNRANWIKGGGGSAL